MLEEKIKEIFSTLSDDEIDLEIINEETEKFFEYYLEEHRVEFNTFHLERLQFKKAIDRFGLDMFLEFVVKIELMKKEYGVFEAGLRMRKMKKYKKIAEFISKK